MISSEFLQFSYEAFFFFRIYFFFVSSSPLNLYILYFNASNTIGRALWQSAPGSHSLKLPHESACCFPPTCHLLYFLLLCPFIFYSLRALTMKFFPCNLRPGRSTWERIYIWFWKLLGTQQILHPLNKISGLTGFALGFEVPTGTDYS